MTLRTAMEDIGCNKKKLMGVICYRNQEQRSTIRHMYDRKYEEDLVQRLERKLHGNLETAVTLWMRDPYERDAAIIHDALMGWVKDLVAVAEIIYFRTASEIALIGKAYRSTFDRFLEEDIGLKTSGDEKRLLLAFVREDRSEVMEPDIALAKDDASALLAAVSNKKDISKDAIIKITSRLSPVQMKATLDHYKEAYRHSFGKVIKQEIKGGLQRLLRVTMKCAKNPVNYFAKALYKSMKGLGTDDVTLVRLVVMRAEIDMKDIKAHFNQKYGISLQEMIISDTSGSYRTFLLFLIGTQLSDIQSASSLSLFGSRSRR